jgi:hypothetical protein
MEKAKSSEIELIEVPGAGFIGFAPPVNWDEKVTLELTRGELAALWRVYVACPLERKAKAFEDTELGPHAANLFARLNEAIDRP